MAFSGKASKTDSSETIKWTRPTISVPSDGRKSTKSSGVEDSGQFQMTINADTVTFTRPTISLQNLKDNQKSPVGSRNKPKRRISRDDNVKSTDIESVCVGRPTLNLQGKLSSRENNRDSNETPSSDGYGSLADRAQPAPMNESSSWITEPKVEKKTADNRKMLPRQHGAHGGDSVAWTRPTVDVKPSHQKTQQQQYGRQDGDISWTRPTIDVKPNVQKQQQRYGDQESSNKKLPQQGGRGGDDSLSWTRPTINVNPNHQKTSSQTCRQDADSASLVSATNDHHQKPRHKFGRQDGINPDQQRKPHQYEGHDRDSVSWQRPTIDVNPGHQKQYGYQDDVGSQHQKVPSQQYGNREDDVVAWSRPTIDVKPNRQNQYHRQVGVNPEHQLSSNHYDSQDEDSVRWTRPTIDVRSNQDQESIPLYQPNNQPSMDTMRDSYNTDQSDGAYGYRDDQNPDLMVWSRPTLDLDVNTLEQEPEGHLMSASVKKPIERQDSVTEIVASDLARIQALALVNRKGVVVREVDEGQPCLRCAENCPGFISHQWRNICMNCKCARDVHDVYHDGFVNIWDRLGWEVPKDIEPYSDEVAHSFGYGWIPPGVSMEKVEEYMEQLDNHKIPKLDTDGERYREIQLIHQLPKQDLSEEFCKHLKSTTHRKAFQDFCNSRDTEAMGIGKIKEYIKEECKCARSNCGSLIEPGDMAVIATKLSEDLGWHPACFVCGACEELLVDLHYCHKDGQIFCERHYAELERPRCSACDEVVGGKTKDGKDQKGSAPRLERRNSVPHVWSETKIEATPAGEALAKPPPANIHTAEDLLLKQLYESAPRGGVIIIDSEPLIFSGEYTKAMDQDWHSGHFCCWNCDLALTGHRYILRDEHPFCIKCYESLFANPCEECKTPIGTDSKDLSYKEKHWHEKCFKCVDCQKSLVDQPFASKDEKLYCADCHDNNFAPRCDGCGNVFKAGMKKFEFRGKQWHEDCFMCFACKQPIGNKRFIPRDHEFVCVPCYEEQFAQRCAKCNGVINKGGITYKGTPFHRDCFTCSNCSRVLAGEKFTSRDERPYCADCFGELFAKKCCRCARPITGLGGTKFISFDERHWHSDCFGCYKCGASLVGRGFLTCGEDVVCPECGKTM